MAKKTFGKELAGGMTKPKPKVSFSSTSKADSTKSPRFKLDSAMKRNYPGKNIEQLDEHNKPVTPGVSDTPAQRALRKGFKPSMQGGSRLKNF